MKRATRTIIAIAATLLVVALLAPYWSTAMLIARAAAAPRWLLPVARWNARGVSNSIEHVPTRGGVIRTRVFTPDGESARATLLVSGVHPDGIDETRLVSLARELAATGVVVLTPEIEDLKRYRITPGVVDAIEDVTQWMTMRTDRFGESRIGLIGISFSGGLAIVAAGRPSVRDRIAYVLSFGGHGNLPRVLRYLCTGEGGSPTPHIYSLAVVLHQAAEVAVPPEQVAGLRESIEAFLDASAVNRRDPQKGERMFDAVRSRQVEMVEPSATLLKYVVDGNVAALGARLLPYLDSLAQHPALSPDRSPVPTAAVYLLHGVDDNVIPSRESSLLAAHLHGKTRVRHLLSGFLTHADVADRPSVKDTWEMIAFWTALGEEQ
jgi:dienelactone hydrolase